MFAVGFANRSLVPRRIDFLDPIVSGEVDDGMLGVTEVDLGGL